LQLPDAKGDEVLTVLAERLKKDRSFKDVLPLTQTRVPIVKLVDAKTNIACDICFNNLLALHNTRLLRTYTMVDPRVHQLAIVVKYWAKRRYINEPYHGTLSSYCLVLMVIAYLQSRGVAPCLQHIYARGDEESNAVLVDGYNAYFFSDLEHLEDYGFIRGGNQEDVHTLLYGFFKYYSYDFDFKQSVVSVRMGQVITKAEKNWRSERTPAEREELKKKREAERDESRKLREAKQLQEEEKALAADSLQSGAPSSSSSEAAHHDESDESDEEEDETDQNGKQKEKKKRTPTNRFWLCVEDPFEVTHNLGRVVRPKG